MGVWQKKQNPKTLQTPHFMVLALQGPGPFSGLTFGLYLENPNIKLKPSGLAYLELGEKIIDIFPRNKMFLSPTAGRLVVIGQGRGRGNEHQAKKWPTAKIGKRENFWSRVTKIR